MNKIINGDDMKRVIFVFLSLIICFSLGGIRFFTIGTNQSYASASLGNSKSIKLTSLRGTIFDCNSKKLTDTSFEKYALIPANFNGIETVNRFLSENDRKNLSNNIPIKVLVNNSFYSKNITCVSVPKRYSGLSSHIIGYCDSKGNGVCGIEKSYNSVLKGYDIKARFVCDSLGRTTGKAKLSGDPDYKGEGIMLTLDRDIQKICDKTAKEYIKKGAVIVLETKSGKIRGITSSPDFDAYNIESALDSPSSPFFNRAVSSYNCGSIFKLCVAAASLYYNVSLDYNCKGNERCGENVFNCLSKHKKVDLDKALQVSCNCYFIKLGQKIGAKRLYEFAEFIGFGKEIKLTDDIISSGANLPDVSELTEKPSELALLSFGQGSLMTSPLQIASMIQCIANSGKRIVPSLVEGITDSDGRIIKREKKKLPTYILDKDKADKLTGYMINCVKSGTGKKAMPKTGGAGGKTATAETGIFEKGGKAVTQTWFGGFFPKDNPKYCVVVLAENGVSGGSTCAPIFKILADRINEIKK